MRQNQHDKIRSVKASLNDNKTYFNIIKIPHYKLLNPVKYYNRAAKETQINMSMTQQVWLQNVTEKIINISEQRLLSTLALGMTGKV